MSPRHITEKAVDDLSFQIDAEIFPVGTQRSRKHPDSDDDRTDSTRCRPNSDERRAGPALQKEVKRYFSFLPETMSLYPNSDGG